MKKLQRTLFCVGYGYSAAALASLLREDDWVIMATARTDDKADVLRSEGIVPVQIDQEETPDVPINAHWLISAPPGDDGCPGVKVVGDQAKAARWIGYLSTTGVYGDLGGRWAFEWSETRPQSTPGERRALAERQWRHTGGPVHTFRLPGIYGPGRSSFDRLKIGKARRIIKAGQVFSRVHVDDIVSCLKASIERPNPGGVYHPCDDEPAPPQDVIEYAAKLLQMDVPPDISVENANLSEMGKRFYAECKRVSNARTKSELNWSPRYKTYRDGLVSILNADTNGAFEK